MLLQGKQNDLKKNWKQFEFIIGNMAQLESLFHVEIGQAKRLIQDLSDTTQSSSENNIGLSGFCLKNIYDAESYIYIIIPLYSEV